MTCRCGRVREEEKYRYDDWQILSFSFWEDVFNQTGEDLRRKTGGRRGKSVPIFKYEE